MAYKQMYNWKCNCGQRGFEAQPSEQMAQATSLDHQCNRKEVELTTSLEPITRYNR